MAKPQTASSRYKGVSLDRPSGRYVAGTRKDHVRVYLGHWDNELHAALAYNLAVQLLHGPRPQLLLNDIPQDQLPSREEIAKIEEFVKYRLDERTKHAQSCPLDQQPAAIELQTS